jgi:hypothetical protein
MEGELNTVIRDKIDFHADFPDGMHADPESRIPIELASPGGEKPSSRDDYNRHIGVRRLQRFVYFIPGHFRQLHIQKDQFKRLLVRKLLKRTDGPTTSLP